MKNNNTNKMGLKFIKWFLPVFMVVVFGCETDDEQTVSRFTELTLSEEFDTDGAPNSSIWGYDIGTGENGWGNQELRHGVPPPTTTPQCQWEPKRPRQMPIIR